MGPDAKGRFYIGNQAQGGLVIFDPSTEKFRFENPPGAGEMMDFEPLDLFQEIGLIGQQRRNGNQRPKRFRDTLSEF